MVYSRLASRVLQEPAVIWRMARDPAFPEVAVAPPYMVFSLNMVFSLTPRDAYLA